MRVWIITFLILIAIPFSQAHGEKDSTLLFKQELGIEKQLSINKDSFPVVNLEQESKPQKRGPFRFVGTFGFGRYDNFTKSKSSTYPQLRTGSTYLSLNAEFGINKVAYFAFHGSSMFPLSGKEIVRDTLHKTDFFLLGSFIRVPLLPRESIVNAAPLVGYKYLSEHGVIHPKETQSPLLNKYYDDYGPLFGLYLNFTVFKWSWSELRIIPGFTRENLKKADSKRYRINLAYGEDYFSKSLKTEEQKEDWVDQLEFSLGIEITNWSDGRKERFFTFSFAFDGPW